MKKILIVHNFYRNYGGEDSNIHEEINFLDKHYDVDFFQTKNKESLNFKDLIYLLANNNYSITKKFETKIKQFQPDIVYIHNTWFRVSLGIFKVLSQQNIDTVIKIHNFRYECSRYFMANNHLKTKQFCKACGFKKKRFKFFNQYFKESYLKSLALIWYSKKYFKILTTGHIRLIAISNFHKSKLIKNGVPKDKISVVHNPINSFNENKVEKLNKIIYAGRISAEKGLDELIKSFNKSNLKNYQLLIIGEGSDKQNLLKKYSNNRRIKFLDFLENDEVLEYILTAKAVVTATKLYEGQPRLLCEASSLGTVSIFPSSESMNEFFPDNYPYGFEQFNYETLTQKLNLLENDALRQKTESEVLNFTGKLFKGDNLLKNFEFAINNNE